MCGGRRVAEPGLTEGQTGSFFTCGHSSFSNLNQGFYRAVGSQENTNENYNLAEPMSQEYTTV